MLFIYSKQGSVDVWHVVPVAYSCETPLALTSCDCLAKNNPLSTRDVDDTQTKNRPTGEKRHDSKSPVKQWLQCNGEEDLITWP